MDLVLTAPFVLPANIYGVDLLKTMVSLNLVGAGKHYISDLPNKEELQSRMIELWLSDIPKADEIFAEAVSVRDELARAIGRARQARRRQHMDRIAQERHEVIERVA